MDMDNYNEIGAKKNIIIGIVLLVTVILAVWPMKLSPWWNGVVQEHRNQYELLADSFLNGHLYIEYKHVDRKLSEMENPYDPEARIIEGVSYRWDHAFYKGKYYMYFGVAPVIFTFIPYKLITGESLNTYHATQIYTALFIIGLFMFFYNICKFFNYKMKLGIYLLISSVFSLISVWICISRPALYCTAISAGLCCAIWSLYFFFKSVYGNYSLNKSILLATVGGFFGALTFTCRPPIGFINFLAIPLLITFFKKHGFNKNTILKVSIALIPYVIIGGLLMAYNYARFENVFEFGQSYQLTSADQHEYLNIFSRFNILSIINGIGYNFFTVKKLNNIFPYINICGAFINFPIFLLPYSFMLNRDFRDNLKEKNLKGFYIVLLILPFVVTIFDVLGSPNLNARYRLDVYYLLAISTFIGLASCTLINNKKLIKNALIIYLIVALLTCVLLFFIPNDKNFTVYYSSLNQTINDFFLKIINFIKGIFSPN